MNYQLVFTEQYNRRALCFIKHQSDLKKQYIKTLKLLAAKSDGRIRNSPLYTGKMREKQSLHYAGLLENEFNQIASHNVLSQIFSVCYPQIQVRLKIGLSKFSTLIKRHKLKLWLRGV